MNKYRNTYKEFFGLSEQQEKENFLDSNKLEKTKKAIEDLTPAIEKFADASKKAGLTVTESDRVECSQCKGEGCDHCDGTGYHETKNETNLTEAELINKMRNYRGGVEYVLYDPVTADMVLDDIKTWAEKKGFTIIKMEKSPSGKIGYFYFRLGQKPFKEAKKIQGYISQLEQVKHFRFNVRQKKKKINKPLK
jgi:hypothetical protein